MPKRAPLSEKTCLGCGRPFITKIGVKRERCVCSKECANSYFHSYKNPNFTRKDRHEPYRAICWRYHVKRCIICGEERIVEAHHHNGKHNDNRPENFVPLCPTHHQYWHSQYRKLVNDIVEEYALKMKSLCSSMDRTSGFDPES